MCSNHVVRLRHGFSLPCRTECRFPINARYWRDGYGFNGLQGLFGVAVWYRKDHDVYGCYNDNLAVPDKFGVNGSAKVTDLL